jgi:hypothetical protein
MREEAAGTTYSRRLVMNDELGRIWEEAVLACCKALALRSFRETGESNRTFQSGHPASISRTELGTLQTQSKSINLMVILLTFGFTYIYLLTYLRTYLLTKILLSYGTRSFITVFTQARHWTLSWASWIQLAPSIPISIRSILLLSSHLCLGLPSGLLPSGLPTKTLQTPLPSPLRATCPARFILFDLI